MLTSGTSKAKSWKLTPTAVEKLSQMEVHCEYTRFVNGNIHYGCEPTDCLDSRSPRVRRCKRDTPGVPETASFRIN